ncbi:VonWillebr and factor type A domain-containing protein [Haloferula helveola]|uniref:vonWillebr and factor type A domain-containing protein n=1 Tax=Haloferula helveola TaxID=490095 RepID=A0ABN6H3Z3_9BACT|nr:VonWillebr and factor type A domain-containing protein [Haloferula helveola]
MSFHHPEFLWLLALPLGWGFWQWVRRGHAVALPFDHGAQGEGRVPRFMIHLAGTLPAVILAVAVLMLAGPRRPAPPSDERVLNNILICIDVSGSMGVPFGSGGTRFEAAVEAARSFCEFRKGDAFGLTVFGSEYIHWVPPTAELSAVSNAMNYVRPDNMPGWMGGTLIGNALRGCRDQLVRIGEGDRAVVLISDGQSGDFSNGGDRAVAEELAKDDIRVFGILIGDGTGAAGLDTVSATTGGRTFVAGDPGALDEIFREIDRMQKANFKPSTAEWVDYHEPFAIAGVSALLLYSITLLGLRYTPW